MRRSTVILAVAMFVATAALQAQDRTRATVVKRDRVDLSGRWEVADPNAPAVLGKSFTAIQDSAGLIVETQTFNTSSQNGATVTTPGDLRRHTYAFDGVETRETFPAPARIAQMDPSRVLSSYISSSSSRAAWRGDLLVVVVHNRSHVNYPKRTPSQFDTEQTMRLSFSLDDKGILTVERVIIADPDFDSNLRMDLPGVVKSLYKRAAG